MANPPPNLVRRLYGYQAGALVRRVSTGQPGIVRDCTHRESIYTVDLKLDDGLYGRTLVKADDLEPADGWLVRTIKGLFK